MTIKTISRLPILALLLASGSLPIRAEESDPCSSAAPIMPDDTVSDADSNVAAARSGEGGAPLSPRHRAARL
ncbi:MAG: hypothetical protein OXO50_00620 [Caldilineaceae bacterium]|nr:hypothetical protein [Caldilineaceae bacterium]